MFTYLDLGLIFFYFSAMKGLRRRKYFIDFFPLNCRFALCVSKKVIKTALNGEVCQQIYKMGFYKFLYPGIQEFTLIVKKSGYF